ncbi:hypothetical protein [Xanthomonas campestris]|uniref:hypothetical protein n=1 Tax=Xanthomonas campestris TaxID=339 RepID=UPI001E46D829|nr:hypothetical protein [Xanthomonas campestris]
MLDLARLEGLASFRICEVVEFNPIHLRMLRMRCMANFDGTGRLGDTACVNSFVAA